MKVLSRQTGRQAPLPPGPWIMRQRWHNLLFAHWPVPADQLRQVVPGELEIDTCDGQAWLGIVVFRLTGIKLRLLPEVPALASFPEVNVRTYVRYKGRPGVYFLSLDADNPLSVALARPWFKLNYYNAEVDFHADKEGVHVASRRLERGIPEARLQVCYRPTAGETCRPGPLERWLTERYCYYAVRRHRVYRCDIDHPQWPLQPAAASFAENSMAQAHGIELPAETPLLHYVRFMEAHVWLLRRAEFGLPGLERIGCAVGVGAAKQRVASAYIGEQTVNGTSPY